MSKGFPARIFQPEVGGDTLLHPVDRMGTSGLKYKEIVNTPPPPPRNISVRIHYQGQVLSSSTAILERPQSRSSLNRATHGHYVRKGRQRTFKASLGGFLAAVPLCAALVISIASPGAMAANELEPGKGQEELSGAVSSIKDFSSITSRTFPDVEKGESWYYRNFERLIRDDERIRDDESKFWYYRNFERLIRDYNCVAGFPDRKFRSEQAATRSETVTLVNSCLNNLSKPNSNTISSINSNTISSTILTTSVISLFLATLASSRISIVSIISDILKRILDWIFSKLPISKSREKIKSYLLLFTYSV